MTEKLILIVIIVVSIIIGFILSRVFAYVEIHTLKDQLFELEKDNENIIKDNANLVRQNDVLRKKLYEISRRHTNDDIKFGD